MLSRQPAALIDNIWALTYSELLWLVVKMIVL